MPCLSGVFQISRRGMRSQRSEESDHFIAEDASNVSDMTKDWALAASVGLVANDKVWRTRLQC